MKIDSWVRKSIFCFSEISEYYSERGLALNAIDYAIIDFDFRALIHSMIESVDSILTEEHHDYQHEISQD